MEITVINKTKFTLDNRELKVVCNWLEKEINSLPGEVSLVFIADEEISKLNKKFYHRQGVTDVLAFPYENNMAEIFLNPYQHRRQAEEYGNSFPEEVVENILHAFLHLAGYDHTENDDNRHLDRQQEVMNKFKKKTFKPLIAPEK